MVDVPDTPMIATADTQSKDIEAAARTLGLRTYLLHASTEQDFDGVSASLLQLRANGLVIGAGDPFFFSRCNQLVELATHISVATIDP
jgi:putative ABC transport system substrate-binding protein